MQILFILEMKVVEVVAQVLLLVVVAVPDHQLHHMHGPLAAVEGVPVQCVLL